MPFQHPEEIGPYGHVRANWTTSTTRDDPGCEA